MTPARNSSRSRVAGLSAHATVHSKAAMIYLCARAVSMSLSTFITVASNAVQDAPSPVAPYPSPLHTHSTHNNSERTTALARSQLTRMLGLWEVFSLFAFSSSSSFFLSFSLSSFLCVARATAYSAKTRDQSEGMNVRAWSVEPITLFPTQRYGSSVKK